MLKTILSKFGKIRTAEKNNIKFFFADDLGYLCGYNIERTKFKVKKKFFNEYFRFRVYNTVIQEWEMRMLLNTEQAIEFIKSSSKTKAQKIIKALEEAGY